MQSSTHVLIVDDDIGIQASLMDILSDIGYIVDAATNGTEALAKSRDLDYNAYFIDHRLPDMSGLELLKELKNNSPQCVCIMITGFASLENSVAAMREGADGYFEKPFNVKELLTNLETTLEKQLLKRQLEESIERFHVLTDQSLMGAILFQERRVIYANQAMADLMEDSIESIMGNDLDWFLGQMDEESKEDARLVITRVELATLDHVRFTSHLILSSGTSRWIDTFCRLVSSGKSVVLSIVLVDISDKVLAEEGLRTLNQDLETKIMERTRELEEANAAKSAFLANMSHELRTPLNSIIGFSDALMKDLAGPITETQRGYIQDILESGEHLLALINDILDISKIEAGKMELNYSTFPLKPFMEKCIDMFKERNIMHQISTELQVPEDLMDASITADEIRIKQVLINLLSNASKFTPDGRTITVSASQDETCTTICVKDTGIGIDPKDIPRLFKPFEQIRNENKPDSGGTGLGLHFSKNIIELHGGQIWVESMPSVGSRFFFTIPLDPPR